MNDTPIIDPKAIERLREWGGTELPKKMIDIFLSHSPERIDQIREGLSAATIRAAERGAHSLKSSAGNVGAVRLQRLSEKAESLAESGDLTGLVESFPALEVAFGEACDELKRLLEEMEG